MLFAALTCSGAGLFEKSNDIGDTKIAGTVEFDASSSSYTVVGSGANMWFTNDAFHFVWKQFSGDVTLAADISFLGAGGDPHRKACLLVRQSLDTGSAYADAAIHGDPWRWFDLAAISSRRE